MIFRLNRMGHDRVCPFIDGNLNHSHADRWEKQLCFQLLRLQDDEAVASRKGSISGQHGREMAFLTPEMVQNRSET